jgi:hypothetical protein
VTNTVGALIFSGSVILLALVYEWAVLGLGLAALVFQGVAVLLVLVNRLWERSRRFLIYPVIVFCTIYLWDTRLPPPNLPDGLLRGWIPPLVIGALSVDLVYTYWRRRFTRARPRGFDVVGGYVDLDEVAAFFDIAPEELKQRLKQSNSSSLVAVNGHEYVLWPELIQVLAEKSGTFLGNRHSS